MKSPIYLRRALIAGTAAARAVAGIAVGAAPTFAADQVLPINNSTDPAAPVFNSAVCDVSQASPTLAQQPIQTNVPVSWGSNAANNALHSPPVAGSTAAVGSEWFLAPSTVVGTPAATTGTTGASPSGWTLIGGNVPNTGAGEATCNGVDSYVVASDATKVNQKWEGPQLQLAGASTTDPTGTKTVSVNVYVDTSEPTQVGGLFANGNTFGAIYVGSQASNIVNPDGTHPVTDNNNPLSSGWNVYNPVTKTWHLVSGVASTSGWYNVEIAVTSAGNYQYFINGTPFGVQIGGDAATTAQVTPPLNLADASLVNYNNGFKSTDTWFQGLSTSTNGNPTGKLTVNTLSGSDRYATAVAISKADFPNGFVNGTGTVVLATGQNYADALSGAPLAALEKGPLLLTQTNTLPSVVQAELVRLHPANVIVLGGFGAVASSVYDQIRAAIPGVNLVQVAGADRYATSLAIAQNYFSSTNNGQLDNGIINNKVTDAFIATGTAFPDALSAAPAAGSAYSLAGPPAVTKTPFPVLLVNGTSTTIPAALSIWLQTNVTHTLYVAGGSGAVSPAVVNQLASNIKGSVHPFSGTDRYDTNFLINGNNTQAQNTDTSWGVRFFSNPTTVYLATGLDYPDALTGGAAAGYNDSPLFLTNGTCVPANVLSAIQSWRTVTTVNVLGGTGAQAASIAALKSC